MQKEKKSSISKASYGKTNDGKEVFLWTLKNKNGITIKITNYGSIVTNIIVPDKAGKMEDIALGYDNLKSYIKSTPYFGALIGRYGNRIAKGVFKLDGKEYRLKQNNNGNHLHGGEKGFDKVVWQAKEISDTNKVGLRLNYLSKDGEEGYPGNLNVTVDYLLNDENEFSISYEATTDKATPVNLTHHSYFNLTGMKRDILSHEVMINSDKYMAVNEELIPTGKFVNVDNTPFDFKQYHTIGERIVNTAGGYDHNFILNNTSVKIHLAAIVTEPESERTLEVYTSEPGMQFYSGNFLDGTLIGKNSIAYKQHYGFCMETQHYPDSPNHPEFPSTILKPGAKYSHVCIYKFGVKKF